MTANTTQRRILAAIAAGPLAWSDAAEVAAAIEAEPAAIATAFETLETEGLTSRWTVNDRVLWTLTPLAADRLAVAMVETGLAELPQWQPATDPTPPIHEPRTPRTRPDTLTRAGLIERPAPTSPEPPPCTPTPTHRGPSKTLAMLWGFPLW